MHLQSFMSHLILKIREQKRNLRTNHVNCNSSKISKCNFVLMVLLILQINTCLRLTSFKTLLNHLILLDTRCRYLLLVFLTLLLFMQIKKRTLNLKLSDIIEGHNINVK